MIAARQAVRDAVRRLDEAIEPLGRRASITGVHQARSAARKVGDTLSTFDVELEVLQKQARLVKDALGAVRDLHVSGVRRGPRLRWATASMRKALADWRAVRPLVNRELRTLVCTESAKKLLYERLRKLEKRIDGLPQRAPARQAHRLRLKMKRARTAVALVAPSQTGLLKKLKLAARALGQLHDLDAGLDRRGSSRKQLLRDVNPALERLRSAL